MSEKSKIERGEGLSDLIAHHNARIGIGRRWAKIGFNLWLARRSPWAFLIYRARKIGGAS